MLNIVVVEGIQKEFAEVKSRHSHSLDAVA
jgi:hypothetical protein